MEANLLSNTFGPSSIHWKILRTAKCEDWRFIYLAVFKVSQKFYIHNWRCFFFFAQTKSIFKETVGPTTAATLFVITIFKVKLRKSKRKLGSVFLLLLRNFQFLSQCYTDARQPLCPPTLTAQSNCAEQLYVPCGKFPLVVWRDYNESFYGAI